MSCIDRLSPIVACITRGTDVEILLSVGDAAGHDRDYTDAEIGACVLTPSVGAPYEIEDVSLTTSPSVMPQIRIHLTAEETQDLVVPQVIEVSVEITRADEGRERPRIRLELH